MAEENKKITKELQALTTSDPSILSVSLDATINNIIPNIQAGHKLDYFGRQFVSFIEEIGLDGFKYRKAGVLNWYAWPSVKPGKYLVGRKHNDIPYVEQTIKHEFTFATSYSYDHFDKKGGKNSAQYWADITRSFVESKISHIAFVAYVIFRGTKNGSNYNYIPNGMLEGYYDTNFNPTNASSNGYPMLAPTFHLDDAIKSDHKVTNNDIKKHLEDEIRKKIFESKIEIDTSNDELKKNLVNKNITITEDNKEWIKYKVLQWKVWDTLRRMAESPKDYSVVANTLNINVMMQRSDFYIMASPTTRVRYENSIMFNDSNASLWDPKLFAGINIFESDYIDEDKVIIIHKDCLKILVDGRDTITWSAPYEDPRITNYNSTTKMMVALIPELPCKVIQFKTS